jgi:hypothetical protein
MKKLKYKIAALVCGIGLIISTTFTVNAVEKQKRQWLYEYTTPCGTYYTIVSSTELTQAQISTWHRTCDFFDGCL